MSDTRYTHRNGEKVPPTISDWFWAQEPDGRERMVFVGDNAPPPNDPFNIVSWFANYAGDQWDMRLEDVVGWRWWGPVEIPDMRQ